MRKMEVLTISYTCHFLDIVLNPLDHSHYDREFSYSAERVEIRNLHPIESIAIVPIFHRRADRIMRMIFRYPRLRYLGSYICP